MTDLEALERQWQAASAPLTGSGTVRHLVIRTGDGVHEMPARIDLTVEEAIAGDRWLTSDPRHPDAQVSLIEHRAASILTGGDPALLHVPGDNLIVDLDLGVVALPVGSRLEVGTAVLEITGKVHAGCAKFSARLGADAMRWVNEHEHRPRRMRGVYAIVVRAGSIAIGDRIVQIVGC